MKVFFTASFVNKKTHQKYYDKIVNVIKDQGHELISLEVQDYDALIKKSTIEKKDEEEVHYLYISKGMKKANAVIIEVSKDSFRLGHEATLALLYNKPVLCLSDDWDYSTAIYHPKFYSDMYEGLDDIEGKVVGFLEMVDRKHMAVRSNVYFTPDEKNFLSWYSKKSGKSISEILRNQVDSLKEDHEDYDILRT